MDSSRRYQDGAARVEPLVYTKMTRAKKENMVREVYVRALAKASDDDTLHSVLSTTRLSPYVVVSGSNLNREGLFCSKKRSLNLRFSLISAWRADELRLMG